MRRACIIAFLSLCLGCQRNGEQADERPPANTRAPVSTQVKHSPSSSPTSYEAADGLHCAAVLLGATRVRTYERTASFEVQRGDGNDPLRQTEKAIIRERIDALGPKGIKRLEVTFVKHEPAAGSDTPNLEGKTFRVERHAVSKAGGAMAEPAESSFVRSLYGDLDAVLLSKHIPKRLPPPGGAIPSLARHLQQTFGSPENPFQARHVTVTLEGATADTIQFTIDLDAALEQQRGEVAYKLRGPLVVRTRDCQPIRTYLEGTVATAGGAGLRGIFAVENRYEYDDAPSVNLQ